MSVIKSTRLTSGRIVKGMSILLMLAVLVGMLPGAALAAKKDEKQCYGTHIVAVGETLNSIAKKYTVKFAELVERNKLEEPYKIYVGQVLCLPKHSKIGAVGTGKQGDASPGNFTVTHTRNGFTISFSNFPDDSKWKVKVDNTSDTSSRWTIVGTLRNKEDSRGTRSYELNSELRKAVYLNICLKNQKTDQLLCRPTIRYVP